MATARRPRGRRPYIATDSFGFLIRLVCAGKRVHVCLGDWETALSHPSRPSGFSTRGRAPLPVRDHSDTSTGLGHVRGYGESWHDHKNHKNKKKELIIPLCARNDKKKKALQTVPSGALDKAEMGTQTDPWSQDQLVTSGFDPRRYEQLKNIGLARERHRTAPVVMRGTLRRDKKPIKSS